MTKKPLKMKASRIWTDEDLEELKSLYNEFKDSIDPVKRIMERLKVQRQKKRVVEKIMGTLVSSKTAQYLVASIVK